MKTFYFYEVHAIGKHGQVVARYAIPRSIWDARKNHDDGLRILRDWMSKAKNPRTAHHYKYAPAYDIVPPMPGSVK